MAARQTLDATFPGGSSNGRDILVDAIRAVWVFGGQSVLEAITCMEALNDSPQLDLANSSDIDV